MQDPKSEAVTRQRMPESSGTLMCALWAKQTRVCGEMARPLADGDATVFESRSFIWCQEIPALYLEAAAS